MIHFILTIKYIFNIPLVASQSSAPQRGKNSNPFLTETAFSSKILYAE